MTGRGGGAAPNGSVAVTPVPPERPARDAPLTPQQSRHIYACMSPEEMQHYRATIRSVTLQPMLRDGLPWTLVAVGGAYALQYTWRVFPKRFWPKSLYIIGGVAFVLAYLEGFSSRFYKHFIPLERQLWAKYGDDDTSNDTTSE